MTIAGWLFMSASWLVILTLFVFCMSRTLRPKDRNNSKKGE
jgi:hypothetical protein